MSETSEPQWEYAKAIADEAIRRFADEVGDPYRIDHTVQVTSFGGAGTTALVQRFLDAGVDLQRGPAQWPFKHRRKPPTADEVPPGFRVVYVVADPRDAVLSIFRRHLQIGHYAALHGTQPGAEIRGHLASLDAFLNHGVDLFELGDHVNGWLEHPPGYEVLFIRYEHLAGRFAEVCEFIGLEASQPGMPAHVRRSDWRSAPGRTRRRLNAIYGDLAREIDEMPPVRIA